MRVWGSGLSVEDLEFRVRALGLRVWGLGLGVQGLVSGVCGQTTLNIETAKRCSDATNSVTICELEHFLNRSSRANP